MSLMDSVRDKFQLLAKCKIDEKPRLLCPEPIDAARAADVLTAACFIRGYNAGWWHNIKTGESQLANRNVGELLCLIHSEISEAMEGYRKNQQDDHLPNRKAFEVELADAVIRIFDLAGGYNLDLAGAIAEKLAYNERRADHKPENRLKEGGKKF